MGEILKNPVAAEKAAKGKNARENSGIRAAYQHHIWKKLFFMVFLLLLTLFLSAFIITIGPLDLSVWEVYHILYNELLVLLSTLLNLIFPNSFEVIETPGNVVWDIRFPRVVAGLLAGFGLGICGCVMQAVLKNPLASPFTLGISAGASFGVAVAAVLGVGIIGGPYLLVGNAFLFAMLCSLFIIGLASFKGATSETLILAGIAVNYLFSSLSSLFQYFATDEQLRLIVSWGMGDLAAFSWKNFPLLLVIFLICIPLIYLKANDLNLMTIGDESAKSLGVNANEVRIFTMLLASLLVATIVCFTGTIAFIGLVAPHVARMLIGADHRFLLPASGLLGALLLIASDAVALNIISPTTIPTGIMCSLLGVPFFIYLIVKGKRKEFW
ncbi:MAG: iron ABC transporter permease [Methanosarcinaceae archaeon]|nr:iron ABC transporter permease [Methanosarcinaceae archaeon]